MDVYREIPPTVITPGSLGRSSEVGLSPPMADRTGRSPFGFGRTVFPLPHEGLPVLYRSLYAQVASVAPLPSAGVCPAFHTTRNCPARHDGSRPSGCHCG